MKVWHVSPTNPTPEQLQDPAATLQAGKLVAFPTETVYGLGANALDEAAVRRIFRVKGRPADNPLIVHIASIEDLALVTPNPDAIPAAATRDMAAFWPGPLTIVLPASPRLAPSVHPGMETVGVRMPAHPVAQMLIGLAGCPIAAPSANRSGRPSPTCAGDVAEDLADYLDAEEGVVDGGSCEVGVESTVIAVTDEEVVIYRPGGVSQEELERELGIPVRLDPHLQLDHVQAHANSHLAPAQRIPDQSSDATQAADLLEPEYQGQELQAPPSPGMKYRHYAPKATVIVWCGDSSRVREAMRQFALANVTNPIAIIGRTTWPSCPANAVCWTAAEAGGEAEAGAGGAAESEVERDEHTLESKEAHESDEPYAATLSRELYRLLRDFDRQGVTHILVEGVELEGLGLAVMNRLSKASEGRIFHV